MKWFTRKQLLPVCIFAVCSIGVSQANIIDTPLVPFSTTGTIAVNLAFQQFDPSLGTLTSVTLKGNNVGQNMSVEVSNSGAGAVAEAANFQLELELNGLPNFLTDLLDQTLGSVSCSGSGHEFNSCDKSMLFSDSYPSIQILELNGSNAPYLGTGIMPATINVFQEVFPTTDTPAGGSAFYNSSSSSGSLFLEYTYTPATSRTPEPATVWISAIGILLIGRLHARRRSRSERRS